MDFAELQQKTGCHFNDEQLLIQAFTHSSYVNEHRNKKFEDNERLEYLGDAVLELGVSQFLFREYPEMAEGELTKFRASIVREASLVNFAEELEFGDLILLGKGEEMTGGRSRPALLADAYESFIGALFIDQGFDEVLRFLEKFVFRKISKGAFSHAMDYKSQLQEIVQRSKRGNVEYTVVEEKGPAHNKEFISLVRIAGNIAGEGIGRTKKEAEQRAAKKALDGYADRRKKKKK